MRTRTLPVALGLLVESAAALASVFETDSKGNRLHWDLVTPGIHVGSGAAIPVSTNVVNPVTKAIRFYLGADGYSTTNTAAELNAVRDAFALWAGVPQTVLKFEEAGVLPPGRDANPVDSTNVVFWIRDASLLGAGTVDAYNVTAVTFFASISGILVGADIALNGDLEDGPYWFTREDPLPPSSRYHFVEAIALHEIGHWVGIDHSPAGATTMFYRDPGGLGPYLGLSADEVAGVEATYPASGVASQRGTLTGTVTRSGTGILGAAVFADDARGNLASATLTRSNGVYELPGLLPGAYRVRVAPLDPRLAFGLYLVRGIDIVASYANAQTSFPATADREAAVVAGGSTTTDFAVAAVAPPLRIRGLQLPSTNPAPSAPVNQAARLRVGQAGLWMGVYASESLTNATFSVTGTGVRVQGFSRTNAYGYNLLSAQVSVDLGAAPGLRTLIVQRGADLAYANGFLEILPAWPDDNVDGLDDTFQRRYFSPWTAAAASPAADPDGDRFPNDYEAWGDSDPTASASLPVVRLESVTVTVEGATLRWAGFPGGRYQVESRPALHPASPWVRLGESMAPASGEAEYFHASGQATMRYYRVLALPISKSGATARP